MSNIIETSPTRWIFMLLLAATVGEYRGSQAADTVGALQTSVDDWPWWRGPERNGHAAASQPATRWAADKNVAWKARIPGRGHSSPTVIGQLIALQTAD